MEKPAYICLVLLIVWNGCSRAQLAHYISVNERTLAGAFCSPVGVACLNNRIYFADSDWDSSVQVFTAGKQHELRNTKYKWTDLADPFSWMFTFNSLVGGDGMDIFVDRPEDPDDDADL
jgi:hypothetical protein